TSPESGSPGARPARSSVPVGLWLVRRQARPGSLPGLLPGSPPQLTRGPGRPRRGPDPAQGTIVVAILAEVAQLEPQQLALEPEALLRRPAAAVGPSPGIDYDVGTWGPM